MSQPCRNREDTTAISFAPYWVWQVLQNRVRPSVQDDGGDVELKACQLRSLFARPASFQGCPYMYTYIQTCIHTYINTYVLVRTYIHTYAYIHITVCVLCSLLHSCLGGTRRRGPGALGKFATGGGMSLRGYPALQRQAALELSLRESGLPGAS